MICVLILRLAQPGTEGSERWRKIMEAEDLTRILMKWLRISITLECYLSVYILAIFELKSSRSVSYTMFFLENSNSLELGGLCTARLDEHQRVMKYSTGTCQEYEYCRCDERVV